MSSLAVVEQKGAPVYHSRALGGEMLILTGGSGFIGSAVLRRLNEMGRDDIIIVDDLGKGEKWRNLRKGRYADFIHKSDFMERVKSGSISWPVDAVVHLGACSSTTSPDANYLLENNFHYSRDLCKFSLDKGARFINASSAATYGAGEHGFSAEPENTVRLCPLNMYGYSKQLMDLWLLREGLDEKVASLKFFNVYGPNEYHKGEMRSVALKFFERIRDTGEARLFASDTPQIGDGEQKRDFVYVKDCANLIAWLLTDGAKTCGIMNVGTGRATSFNELARAVFKAMGKPERIRYGPMPEILAGKYQNFTRADMGWLQKSGCGVRFRDVESGISDYVRNYLAKSDIYL